MAPIFLTSALDGGEWSAARAGRFALGKRANGTHSIVNRSHVTQFSTDLHEIHDIMSLLKMTHPQRCLR
jgi:hypothetical protein